MKNSRQLERAQSSLEFLMTYGWGLIVVAVVIAALVLLNNPSLVRNGSFTGFKQYMVVSNANYPVSETLPLEFVVINSSGRTLRFSGLKVKYGQEELGGVTKIDGSFVGPYVGAIPVTVPAGASKNIGFYSTSDWFPGPLNLSVDFVAADTDGFPKNSSGSVSFTAVNGSGCPEECDLGTKQCNDYLPALQEACVTVSGCNVWGPPYTCDGPCNMGGCNIN